MNDRELLELAAKAAGLKVSWGDKTTMGSDVYDFTDLLFVDGSDHCMVWNPLIDDGDALRLAAQMLFIVSIDAGYTRVISQADKATYEYRGGIEGTRRAIVRAAAEIGRAMP